MKQFGTSIFGGYRREEVDDYLDNIILRQEEMKKEIDYLRSNQNSRSNEIDAAEQKAAEAENAAREAEARIRQLELKLLDAEEQNRLLSIEANANSGDGSDKAVFDEKEKMYQQEISDLRAQLEKKSAGQENEINAVKRMLAMAEKEASDTVALAKMDATMIRSKAEDDAKAQSEKAYQQYQLARYKIMDYLNSINVAQKQLVTSYEQLGVLVSKLPLQINDFMDEPIKNDPKSDDVLHRYDEMKKSVFFAESGDHVE